MQNLKWLFFVAVIMTSCGGSSKTESMVSLDAVDKAEAPEQIKFATNSPNERKIIKTGSVDLQVGNVMETKKAIEQLCKEAGAYIASESQQSYDQSIQYTQEIRIPADKFDLFINSVVAFADRVQSRNINTEDVTEEFIDVEARLDTKKQLESRYLDLLKQAKSVADILSIENQIATVRADIESMQGRMNYLKNQTAFSTLSVHYFENTGTDFGFGSRILSALSQGFDNLLVFTIAMLSIWPFLLLVSAFMWLGLRYVYRRRAAKLAGKPTEV
jgi:hypothetical protein